MTSVDTRGNAENVAEGGAGASVVVPAQRTMQHTPEKDVPAVSHGAVLGRYTGYIGFFMGTALISGAVVHHPMDPSRYTKIAVAGVVVFMVATLFNEFVLTRTRPTPRQLLSTMFMALLLSFGVGMLTGGLQHFEDFPQRGAIMIPIGITLSFAAFVLKDSPAVWDRVLGGWAGLAMAVVSVVAFFSLGWLAAGMEPAAGGHSHGAPGVPSDVVAPAAPAEAPAGHEAHGKAETHEGHGH